MIKEAYVNFEVAKLLKEKGFDEPCHYFYKFDSRDIYYGSELTNLQIGDKFYNAPTHQMAMAWLREKHQLHISVDVCPVYGKVKDEKGKNTCGVLYWHYMASGEWMNNKYNPQQKAFVVSGKSYEEAVERALKYSLENLIKEADQ